MIILKTFLDLNSGCLVCIRITTKHFLFILINLLLPETVTVGVLFLH